MSHYSLERLQISDHTRKILNNMGICYIDQLLDTPISKIVQQLDNKSNDLQKIRDLFVQADIQSEIKLVQHCTPKEIWAMSNHSIHELKLSFRAFNALKSEGCNSIAQVALLSEFDLSMLPGLDHYDQNEIKTSLLNWVEYYLSQQHISGSTDTDNQTPEYYVSSSVSRPLAPSHHSIKPPVLGSLFSDNEKPAPRPVLQNNTKATAFDKAFSRSQPSAQSNTRTITSAFVTEPAKEPAAASVPTATQTSSIYARKHPVFGSLFSNEEKTASTTNSAPEHQPRVFGSSHTASSKQSTTPVQQKPVYHSLTNNNKAVVGESVNDNLKLVAALLGPIIKLDWAQLGNYLIQEGMLEQFDQSSPEKALIIALNLKFIRHKINTFWTNMSNQGVITRPYLIDGLKTAKLSFHPTILIEISLKAGILTRCSDALLLSRMTFAQFFTRFHNQEDHNTKIFKARLKGHSISDIAEMFGTSTSEVNQIIDWVKSTFPELFEDYFRDPFCYFNLDQDIFCQIFPEISDEGYRFMVLRYYNDKAGCLNHHTLDLYSGLWKHRLEQFLQEHADYLENRYTQNSLNALAQRSHEETVPAPQTELQNNTMAMAFSEAFSRSQPNDIAYSSASAHIEDKSAPVSTQLDTRATTHAAEEPAKEPAITTAPEKQPKQVPVQEYSAAPGTLFPHPEPEPRQEPEQQHAPVQEHTPEQVPEPVHEHAHEQLRTSDATDATVEVQASEQDEQEQELEQAHPQHLAETQQPASVRKTAQETKAPEPDNEPVIPDDYDLLRKFSPRPTIDERDLLLLLKALQVRQLWFMDELASLLEMLCIHTQSEALNTHAFRLIGYILRVKYAYPRKYNSIEECLEQSVFAQDVIELKGRNRKLLAIDEFKDLLDQKKLSLEYLEIAPKTLWSWRKIQSEYGINLKELQTAQTLLQEYCQEPFFNGRSILEKVKDLEFIKKLKGQDLLLTTILQQQKSISSLEVAGGTILSSTQTDFTLGQICAWLVSQHGTMSLDELTDTFNQTFNTALDNANLEQELKSEHLWNNVMDVSLAQGSTTDSDADDDFDDDDYDLFKSEFF